MARALGGGTREGVLERVELAAAPDHRRVEATRVRQSTPGSTSSESVRRDRLIPFQRAAQRLRADCVTSEAVGRSPIRISPDSAARLETLRDVDGVAGGERVARSVSPAITSPLLTPMRTSMRTP